MAEPPISSIPKFLTLKDVTDVLNTSLSQVRALVNRGDLKAMQIGNRKQWRVHPDDLQEYVDRMYSATEDKIRERQPEVAGASATDLPVAEVKAE